MSATYSSIDNDNYLDDLEDERDQLIYDPDKINIVTKEPTIEQLLRRIDEEALDLAPNFQRQTDVWKNDAKSRLIESILIRIPLPAFYIDATDEEKWLVVDGIQRLFALKQFVTDKKLKLSGLEYLTNFKDKTFDQLDRRYQRRIEETQVTTYLISKGTPPEVKYNIFKRINTGGEPLSPQELRHALNPGKATKLLTKLAASDEFKKAVELGKSRKMRMEDQEFILGFIAFKLTSYQNYQQETETRDLFLTKALSRANTLSEDELGKLENDFKKAMILAYDIFGNEAFRKLSRKKIKKQPINKALFEAWSVNLSNLNDSEANLLRQKKQNLINLFIDYVDDDQDFFKSISQAADKVEYRFTIINQIIQKILT